jgi:hypothetical protein
VRIEKMTKSIISKIAVLLVVMVVSSGLAFADTADLSLNASRAQILTIDIAEEALADNIDLGVGVTDGKVATATVNSNVVNGYKVTATSANVDGSNNARLLNDDGTADFFVEYTLTFADQNVVFDNATAFYTSNPNDVYVDVLHDIDLTVAADDGTYRAGSYSDTVTFTIASN